MRAFGSLSAATKEIWNDRPWGTLAVFTFVGYIFVTVVNGWMADDAYITFRVVDNLIHGYGPVYNVGERVQAFTNPLMLLLVSAFSLVTREVYFTAMAISLIASAVAVAILSFKVSASRAGSVVALLVLATSNAFVSYSTSGLESCLIFLLAALFFWVYLRSDAHESRDLLAMAGLFGLALVNRMDTALLLFPALVMAFVAARDVPFPKRLGLFLLGLTPFVAWEVFSVIYYGFPFPNTAYAKLYTDIPSREYLVRGGWYYLMTLIQGPLVPLTIMVGSGAIVLNRQPRTVVPLAGVALYLIYILRIGGDFMRGRLLTAPLFIVLLLLVSIPPERWRRLGMREMFVPVVLVAVVLSQSTARMIYTAMDFGHVTSPYGIYDDKAIYFPASNLPLNLVRPQLQKSSQVQKGLELRRTRRSPVVRATLGFTGYYAGPRVHIVDPLALSDALLARMPALYDPGWDIGHVVRYIPPGYLETIETGENSIRDPKLAEYYDKLDLIIAGPIWSRERWAAIAGMNTKKYDYLVDRYYYRYNVEEQYNINSL